MPARNAATWSAGNWPCNLLGTVGVTLYDETPIGRVASFNAYSTISRSFDLQMMRIEGLL
jgi:hypothetical protein